MNKRIVLFPLLFICLFVRSQNWDSLPGDRMNDLVEAVLVDSVHNELIVSSKFITQVGNVQARGIARWNGIRWDSLMGGINTHNRSSNPNSPNGTVLAGIPYNGKLLVGGLFSSIGGFNSTSLALWDGNSWDTLPQRAFPFSSSPPTVAGFYKKNNLIYIYGTFTVIAGQPASGMATWDGINFTPVTGIPVAASFTGISGMIEFQNQMYITGGTFSIAPTYDAYDVLKFDGTNWVSATGGGLQGFAAGVSCMAIYNNELYAGGHFAIADGNPGDNVMKWDGTQWKDVGFYGQEQYGLVKKLLVHHNKLWAIGAYATAAHMPAYCISVYDGATWCSLKDTLDNALNSAAIYNDTIYVGGGFWSAGGNTNIKYFAQLRNPSLYRECKTVGILEEENSRTSFILGPNPASDALYIKGEDLQNSRIEINNTIGQTVLRSEDPNKVNVASLPPGFYHLKLISPSQSVRYSAFIKE